MKKNIILFIVSFAMFMETVDTTIINTAVPMMARSLNVNPIDLKLALISYLVSLAIFIPISGWVADRFGVKKVFIAAISIFTISSIWCGFSHSLSELIIARFIQGLGGSLTIPVGRLIIVRTCERHELVAKMSIVVMVAAVGMMLGPVLGGIITNYFSWRWIFWVNAPVGFLAILLSLFLLPTMPALSIHALDKFGFILFGSGLAILTYGLSTLSESEVQDAYSILMVGIALILLLLYTWHSYKQPHPIVRVELLRSRTFRVSVIGNLLARLGFGGLPFLLPLLLQIGLGFSPQLSGILLAPTALGVLLMKPLSVSILRVLGYKRLLILNTILVGLALWIFSFINQSFSIYSIGFLTFIYGFLISLQYTGMNSLAYANISHDDLSAATSIMSTIQQLAQSFGVAIAAILVKLFSIKFPDHLFLTIETFQQVFFAMGVLTLLSTIIFVRLKKEDGQELIEIHAS
ncbi:DHA2 family efflux MFS transporter permease subunit [Legionella nagasakiensis]|uniref:DHA2 family efflux MFS transporter permease subunit n=1 Tax=Legionella nagasakiensis TaxID=535290 RepID=UPI0010562480|nr:DHA2 family efflux MFS transporter permease subunit [Legionella nagasakiensis]